MALCALVAVAVAGLFACSDKGVPAGGDALAPKAAESVKKAGPRSRSFIRNADVNLPADVMIGHDARNDLFVGCLQLRDAAAKADAGGPPAALCYDPTPRSALKSVRVEYHAEQSFADAIAVLRKGPEAAHFIVERTGSIYQVLDLAYAPRRAGAYQAGEIRILSGSTEGHERLVAALKTQFEALTVEVLAAAAPPDRPKNNVPAPP